MLQACRVNTEHVLFDYADLTGETQWMRRMIDAHSTAAEASGAARALPSARSGRLRHPAKARTSVAYRAA